MIGLGALAILLIVISAYEYEQHEHRKIRRIYGDRIPRRPAWYLRQDEGEE